MKKEQPNERSNEVRDLLHGEFGTYFVLGGGNLRCHEPVSLLGRHRVCCRRWCAHFLGTVQFDLPVQRPRQLVQKHDPDDGLGGLSSVSQEISIEI